MALSRFRTWYTQMNLALADTSSAAATSKSYLYAYYRLLTALVGTNGPEGAPPGGSLWTVEGSSDGTVGALDAVDRWGGGTFSLANFVNATAGTAHSWIVLKSPTALGPLYICIDYSTGATGTAIWYIANTAFTGGSVTARPTSTTESQWQFNGTPHVTLPSSAQPGKVHLCRNSDGGFFSLTSYDGGGFFITMHMVQKLTDTKAGDQFPYFHFWTHNTSAPGVGNNNGFSSGAFGLYSRTFNNLAQAFGQMTGFLTAGITSSENQTVNAVNTDGTLDAVPLYFGWQGATQVGFRGRVEDLYSMYQSISAGAMIPNASPFTFMALRNTVLPFSVSPSL